MKPERIETRELVELLDALSIDIHNNYSMSASCLLDSCSARILELEKDRERLRAALKKGVALVSLENGWGTWRVMESAELYSDAVKFEQEALAAIEEKK